MAGAPISEPSSSAAITPGTGTSVPASRRRTAASRPAVYRASVSCQSGRSQRLSTRRRVEPSGPTRLTPSTAAAMPPCMRPVRATRQPRPVARSIQSRVVALTGVCQGGRLMRRF
jgi:hypothetical protein